MVRHEPNVEPVRRSLRLAMKAQKGAAVLNAPVVQSELTKKMPVRKQIKAENGSIGQTQQTVASSDQQTVARSSVSQERDDEHLERARAELRSPAKRKKATDIRTRIKGVPAQKKVNSRLSSSDSFMSGTEQITPKPRAPRTGRAKYRKEKLPKPSYARSSSSSDESERNVRNTKSEKRPQAGPNAVRSPSSEKKVCMVCGKQDDSFSTTQRDPRICSALSQAIKNGLKGGKVCMCRTEDN